MNTDVHGLIVFISFAKEKMFFKSVFIRENLCPKNAKYDRIHSFFNLATFAQFIFFNFVEKRFIADVQ
jgi:hypothetical protein